jgi:hypothetical protein
MTWSIDEEMLQKKAAFRFLLDRSEGHFTRFRHWCPQSETDVPIGVWTQLYDDNQIEWYAPGGNCFRLTTEGWIESCRFLRDEVDLDKRFGILSAHLKGLTQNRTEARTYTATQAIADATGLPEQWVSDAIEGKMAELLYHERGAKLTDGMGGVEVPAHFGNSLVKSGPNGSQKSA